MNQNQIKAAQLDPLRCLLMVYQVGVLSSTLNGRVQQMNAEVLGEGVGAFLKNATLLPGNLDEEEDDSFFFSQTPKVTLSFYLLPLVHPTLFHFVWCSYVHLSISVC